MANTFKCHCGSEVMDNGTFSYGHCDSCGTFYHAHQRLLPGYDPLNDPYGYGPEPRAESGDAISDSGPKSWVAPVTGEDMADVG